MNARAYRYFAAATVALAIVVAMLADIDPAPADPESIPVVASTPVRTTAIAPQPQASTEIIPMAETFTDTGSDNDFGAPMMEDQGMEDESLEPFGEPQMDTQPEALQ